MTTMSERMRLSQEAAWIDDALANGAIPAEELQLKVVGKSISGRFYSSKNKTARLQPLRTVYVRDLHMYPNGNIMMNGGIYLKTNTPVWVNV